MSLHSIHKYHSEIERLKNFGGTAKETAIGSAFYMEEVIDLLQRVCSVSVETVRIMGEMEEMKTNL